MANASANRQRVLHEIHEVLESSLMSNVAVAVSKQWQISTRNHLPESILPHDWRIMIITPLCLAFLLTYLVTSIKSSMAVRSRKIQKRPPIVPYWLPFFGNLLPFLWDPAAFCSKVVKKYGYSIPVRLRLGPAKMYLVSGPNHNVTLFSNKASRVLSTNGVVFLALENLYGFPHEVIKFYAADDSGINSTPLPGTNIKPQNRVMYLQTRAAHKHLSGSGLIQMTEIYLKVLKGRIDASKVGSKWVNHSDLFGFLQEEVFQAAVEAMCGPHLLAQSPTFVEDFWKFVSYVPTLFKGLPKWMSPEAHRVRGRLLDALKRWHKFAHEHSDCSKTSANDPEWEPYFGSKLIRARQEYGRGMDFTNADALASEDLGLIFATNTNSIPSVVWFFFEICRDSDLLCRVRKDIEACRVNFSDPNEKSFDISKLCSQPLLQSIYAETLRLRVALIVTRTPEHEEFSVGEWTFPPQEMIAISSRAGAMNPEVWNVGTPEDPHPLDSFWADRFLIYPDDPTSGPLRKEHADSTKSHGGPVLTEKAFERAPTFSLDGVAGAWIPYGGGQRMCPGRHFAKQEIIATFAMLLTYYEIELQLPKNDLPECNMGFFPFGGLPPSKAIPFRMRRR